jgi:inward rectifier potassium channel
MLFARFSRPTAKIKFSDVAVVAPYRDQKGFMFRLANERMNQLFEVEAKVLFARFVNENGNKVRRFDLLKLERDRVSLMPLAWTVVHPIDEKSPLRNLSEADLLACESEFLILLSATDESFSQTIHTRSSYKPQEIIWNAKFANIYDNAENDSKISIDVRRLSEIERV